ncbi:histidine kinase [Pedobacter sp. B4-66]|uniref:sensor histidine kinase n=1 Tax=Pedobacter sp. B4-66 TaxID=2817280 RepID=UPI001BD9F54C|nr:histidine kinase [Pedobacter sp. B4-66]
MRNTTNDIKLKPLIGFFGQPLYIILSLIISIPVFLVIETYVRSIDVHEDEAVAFAGTVFFFIGLFTGRYVAQIWTARLTVLPKELSFGLFILIIVCTGWLFFHADFPLHGRIAINLLLSWVPFMLISLSLGALIKIVHAISENQLKEAKTMAAHSKSELHLLQSQLSPHFLFNTLNNMYGLSITDHEKIPALLLKLSELLRYSVYDATEIYVPLKDEVTYINNYIEFEKIRIGDRLVLTTEIEEVIVPEIKIAPMLLIVFIENAFKHSKNTIDEKIYIDIKLKTWGNSILFSVKNSYGSEDNEKGTLNKSSGFGLDNVSKRLNLLYTGEHELNIKRDNSFYNVILQLKMK